MNFKEEAKELVQKLNQRMGPSAYDTAWLARLRTSSNGDPRWPDLLEWLIAHQHPDGSWGGEIVYYHDRIICTLAAIIALRENGHNRQAETAIKHAEQYLWRHMHLLSQDPFELSGFELIFPTLLGEARALGLDTPTHSYGYGKIQTAKLRLIPRGMLYSPRISTVYSLEFLGRSGDPERLQEALTRTGSLGTSPATTAYYLLLSHHDDRALNYLEAVQNHMEHVITVYPFRTFELTWVLNNLAFSGLPITTFADEDIWQELQDDLGPTGAGMDPEFGIPDGDTTSVCCRVLLAAGYDIDPLILAQFEDKRKGVFRTWDYERNVSVSTNAHALEALHLMPNYPDQRRVQEQIVIMLLDNRKYNVYWIDKWHASPYYATSHALVALLKVGGHLALAHRHVVDWCLHTQRDDGSWGFFGHGTPEETAYALMALLHCHRLEPIDPDVLHRGAGYLVRTYQMDDSTHPEFWIAKCLFAPYDVVRSAILAALILYSETFGRSP
jgi:halimadienyl-diphosphate synthase